VRHLEGACQIDCDDFLPLPQRHLLKWHDGIKPGTVDEHLNVTMGLLHVLCEGNDSIRVGYIYA
jgi:hypothetical protein